jgi:Mn2+/Fe2+ NRAMP family transporter
VNKHDPYQLTPEDIAEPPQTILSALRRIGPGVVLAAAIVGSGELIATTTLGARTGFTALWIILLSCAVKPVIQAELGRYTIASGETGLAGLNRVPGPHLKVNWVVWGWALMTLMTLLQIGAMYGGVAQAMHLIVPSVPTGMWVVLFLILTLALLLGGGYNRIEKLAVVKVGLFTMLTVMAAVLLARMPQYFSWAAVREGLSFNLPGEGIPTALAVFGITGVGASELFMYPYWCVEKGYARFTGKREDSDRWRQRARGWVRVMHLDIIASMFIYTIATVAFYLLGAGVLHGMKLVPKDDEMISTLSHIYTQTLGGWSVWLFYAGAIVTLYGTIFAATAANARVFADMFRLMGLFATDDYERRKFWRNFFIIALNVIGIALYFLFKNPVQMVVAGGIAQSLMLPVLGVGAVYLRHRRLPPEIAPSIVTTIFLWIATIVIVCLMSYYVWLRLTQA